MFGSMNGRRKTRDTNGDRYETWGSFEQLPLTRGRPAGRQLLEWAKVYVIFMAVFARLSDGGLTFLKALKKVWNEVNLPRYA